MIKWFKSKVGRSESAEIRDMKTTDTARKQWVKDGGKWVRSRENSLTIEATSPDMKGSFLLSTDSRPASTTNCSSDDETIRCSSFTNDSASEVGLRTQSLPQPLHGNYEKHEKREKREKYDNQRSLSVRWMYTDGDWVKQSASGATDDGAPHQWQQQQQQQVGMASTRRAPLRRRKASAHHADQLPAMLQGAAISFGCVMALPPTAAFASSSCNGKLSAEDHEADACGEVCPICCETRGDVQVLEHWEELGDVSEHKMCGNCRLQYPAHECPFCKELLHKNEFICIMHDFVEDWAASAGNEDPAMMTALFEQWQVLEMQFEGNLRVIGRLAKLVIEDESFVSTLSGAVDRNEEWLRDMAGILFRFWALLHDSGLDCPLYASLIDAAVESILQPLERSEEPLKLPGNYYGALYVQTLTAWLCAAKSGFPTKQLRQLVQRVGAAVVHCYRAYATPALQREVAGSLLTHYMRPSHEPVWGSQEADIVWCTFCRADDENNTTAPRTTDTTAVTSGSGEDAAVEVDEDSASVADEQSEVASETSY